MVSIYKREFSFILRAVERTY